VSDSGLPDLSEPSVLGQPNGCFAISWPSCVRSIMKGNFGSTRAFGAPVNQLTACDHQPPLKGVSHGGCLGTGDTAIQPAFGVALASGHGFKNSDSDLPRIEMRGPT
jgi:hypothetical protein